jgi:hypothetical protein
MAEKGIVVSPPFTALPFGGVQFGGEPDPLELRKYLLYWDKIDYPDNNIISISSPDIDYLQSTGVLNRSLIRFSGHIQIKDGSLFLAAQTVAFNLNEKNQPGCWSIAQQSTSQYYPEQICKEGLEFDLFNILPVPSGKVPLNDILEFKAKRHDELVAFRTYLDEIYQQIIGAKDIPRAKVAALQRLELALKDIDKTLNESGIQRIASSIKTVINEDFTGVLGAGLGGAGLSSVIGMAPLISGLACAGLVLSIKPLIMPKREITNPAMTYIKGIRTNFKA